jgi:hypothetical protein
MGINTEASPLRFAPVEMTKGRFTIPLERVQAGEVFFLGLSAKNTGHYK